MDALSTLKPANRAVADKAFEGVLGKAITKSPGDTIYETSYKPNELRYTSVSKTAVWLYSQRSSSLGAGMLPSTAKKLK